MRQPSRSSRVPQDDNLRSIINCPLLILAGVGQRLDRRPDKANAGSPNLPICTIGVLLAVLWTSEMESQRTLNPFLIVRIYCPQLNEVIVSNGSTTSFQVVSRSSNLLNLSHLLYQRDELLRDNIKTLQTSDGERLARW